MLIHQNFYHLKNKCCDKNQYYLFFCYPIFYHELLLGIYCLNIRRDIRNNENDMRMRWEWGERPEGIGDRDGVSYE